MSWTVLLSDMLLAYMQYRNVASIKDYTTALSHGVDRVNLLGTQSAHMLRPNRRDADEMLSATTAAIGSC